MLSNDKRINADICNMQSEFISMEFYKPIHIHFISCLISTLSAQLSATFLVTEIGSFYGTSRNLNVFGKNMTVQKYLGIPYAEAPVGPRRFQKSVLRTNYPSIHDATKYGASCLQLNLEAGGIRNPKIKEEFSEDCLFLNIFRPFKEKDDSKGLPVMVWFHGGSFVVGSGQLFVGDMLSAHAQVIIVTINYRLNVWGFISTGDYAAPGNLGLWDQHIALKWVHENIVHFGGDPSDVTIFGQSAGGSSVIFQSMFHGNEGYFRRGIALSGSVTCPWSLNRYLAKDTLRLGKLLGCDIKSGGKNIVHCIASRSADEILNILNDRENRFIKFPMAFIPVIDGEFVKEDPVKILNGLTDPSSESLAFFASIDLMTGIVSNEGGMMASPCVDINDPEKFAPTAEELEEIIVPGVTKLMYGDDASDVISDMIIAEYKNWTDPDDVQNIRESFLAMSGHYVFDTHVRLMADFHAKVAQSKNTFVYTVDAFPSQHIVLTPSWMSKPNHADDLTFLFGYDPDGFIAWTEPYSEQFVPDKSELEVSKLLMTAFTNFAKTG